MIDLINSTIIDTANKSGITNVIDIRKDSLTLDKPYLTIEHLSESFDTTGYTLGGANIDKKIKRVLTKYLVHHPIVCTIVTDSADSIREISDTFITVLPRILADKFNNIVHVKVVASSWNPLGDKHAGDILGDTIIQHSRLIEIEFSYHITEDKHYNYIKKVAIKIMNKKGDS